MAQPQNQYLPIATGVNANALTAAQWAALGNLLQQGFQSGVVPSIQFNTFLRQLSVPVAGISQFIADNQTADVLDDGVPANYEAKFKAAILSVVQSEGVVYASDGGTADALVASPTPALTAYRTGQVVAVFKNPSVGANASQAPTINLNGLGAVTIVKKAGTPLYANDLPQGGLFFLVFDGTYFRHLSLTLSTVDLRDQAGQATYVVTSGSNAYTATLTPAPTSLTPGMVLNAVFGTPNTGTSPTLALNGGAALPLLRNGGGAPAIGDLTGPQAIELNTAGTAWLATDFVASDILALITANAPQIVTSNPTVYFRADGNDNVATTNPSQAGGNTAATAFRNPAAAIAWGLSRYFFAGYSLNVVAGTPGTFALPGTLACTTTVNLIGDTSGSGQANYVLSGAGPAAGGSGCIGTTQGVLNVSGFSLNNTTMINHTVVATGGRTNLTNCTWTQGTTSSVYNLFFAPGGIIGIVGGNIISGGTYAKAMFGTSGGSFVLSGTLTVTGTPTFTIFAHFNDLGGFYNISSSISGSANGARYNASTNAVIDTGGGGANFFPGSTAGATGTGGQYV